MIRACVRWACVMSVLSTVACDGGDDDDGAGASDAMSAGSADAGDTADAGTCATGEGRTVFLNRGGGIYHAGPDDSSTNTSRILMAETTLQPFMGAPDWDGLVACVAGKFAPFNVTITEVDPGATPHREVVFTPSPADVGLPSSIGGVAPFECPTAENAEPMAIGVGFIFPGVMGGDPTATCETTAQIIGNMFNLDHAFHCQDLMTYLTGCGDKSFVDMDVQCGEYEARPCACGGDTQNSYQAIAAIAGESCD